MKIYTVLDTKAQRYLLPFYQLTDEAAIRQFAKTALDPKHDFHLFPYDFVLFALGEYDDQTGAITTYETKYSLGNGYELAVKEERDDS